MSGQLKQMEAMLRVATAAIKENNMDGIVGLSITLHKGAVIYIEATPEDFHAVFGGFDLTSSHKHYYYNDGMIGWTVSKAAYEDHMEDIGEPL